MALVSDVSAQRYSGESIKILPRTRRGMLFTTSGVRTDRFSRVWRSEPTKVKEDVRVLLVKSVEWNDEFGGEDLDVLLMNHFLEEFKEKHGSETNGKDESRQEGCG